MSIHIIGLTGLPEVQTGDDIATLIRAATPVVDRETIVVIAQKIVSKAEGAIVDLRDGFLFVMASPFQPERCPDSEIFQLAD